MPRSSARALPHSPRCRTSPKGDVNGWSGYLKMHPLGCTSKFFDLEQRRHVGGKGSGAEHVYCILKVWFQGSTARVLADGFRPHWIFEDPGLRRKGDICVDQRSPAQTTAHDDVHVVVKAQVEQGCE